MSTAYSLSWPHIYPSRELYIVRSSRGDPSGHHQCPPFGPVGGNIYPVPASSGQVTVLVGDNVFKVPIRVSV